MHRHWDFAELYKKQASQVYFAVTQARIKLVLQGSKEQ